jgi:HEAT repeat protein
MATLRSEDQQVALRQAAAKALRELGPAAVAAVGALEALLDDEDIDVADAAMQALLAIRGAPH